MPELISLALVSRASCSGSSWGGVLKTIASRNGGTFEADSIILKQASSYVDLTLLVPRTQSKSRDIISVK
ncbi:MAG: hypothetical protein KJ856_17250 [Gammaproteobacteria bacterium]|nr:hypothetical protein [Gammaproteobacteria bacterium]MBU1478440.1 hypothetical protein [Gammaproteobacteria bacterium]MBU2001443.1 hypothetical protein [Gammaproteobacteria bacterium]MBU2134483.1 hypothetical protein [Gammaproteobacteria bacterium]MBU2188737.1 hypothetical protein [Gammaproteobacteria bacterium]